jgi:hypothetical protein
MVVSQRHDLVAHKTAALKAPSRSAAAMATPANLTVASITLSAKLDYRKLVDDQQTAGARCRQLPILPWTCSW